MKPTMSFASNESHTTSSASGHPPQVTRSQGKVVLIQMGLWEQVQAYVAAIEDPMQKAIAEVAVFAVSTDRARSLPA
jgi:hypothetical protein